MIAGGLFPASSESPRFVSILTQFVEWFVPDLAAPENFSLKFKYLRGHQEIFFLSGKNISHWGRGFHPRVPFGHVPIPPSESMLCEKSCNGDNGGTKIA
jgi:hypothetical protein